VIFKALFFPALIVLNFYIFTEEWGGVYLSVVILLTYFTFRPKYILHPNNMLVGFYGLYVVMASCLSLVLDYIDWNYVLPGGQQIFWNKFSKFTLLQAEFTFLVLYASLYYFTKSNSACVNVLPRYSIRKVPVLLLFGINACIVFLFMESTAGIAAWINDYSYTYLARREGHGVLNFISIAIGNILVFSLGVWTKNTHKKLTPILMAIIAIGLQAFVGGFKGRMIILLLIFYSPWLINKVLSLKALMAIALVFFLILYLTSLLRTEGYYASVPFFLEMLINYFNVYQLHDLVVTSRGPDFFQTIWQVFTKPLQYLGLTGPDVDFDISVMLTKEFFPDSWYQEKATQQWPLDTELYLNFHGLYLSWIPLIWYSFIMGWLYRETVIKQNVWLLLIFISEFIRLFAMLRGTLIPWDVFVLIINYILYYCFSCYCIKLNKS
jgi:hypothetical protein